jgi:hypothetical protein
MLINWVSETVGLASVPSDLFSFRIFAKADRRDPREESGASDPERKKFVQVHEGSVRALSIPVLPSVSNLFSSVESALLLGRYRWTDQWLLCRLFSVDDDGSYSVVWQDGFLQIGTPWKDLRRLSPSLARRIQREIDQVVDDLQCISIVDSSSSPYGKKLAHSEQRAPMTINGLDVWEAAKRGDLETALAIIDRGGATPNDVELLDASDAKSAPAHSAQGRTPLYWACFGGHVELVRELLLRGGVDHDGAAYCAVTSRQVANDHRDILFDPDTGVYSDFVDYDPYQSALDDKTNSDDVLLIRAMLVAIKSADSTNPATLGRRLPKQLYHSSGKECAICLINSAEAITVPCGHVACCLPCVTKVRKRRDGCPLCRTPILAVECSSTSPALSRQVNVVSKDTRNQRDS